MPRQTYPRSAMQDVTSGSSRISRGKVTKKQPGRKSPHTMTETIQETNNPNACSQCRNSGKKCVIEGQFNRFNQCQRCAKTGKIDPARLRRPLCSYAARHVCFYATDFIFKHAPPPYGFDEWHEYAPAGDDYDREKDEKNYAMQFFYVEKPTESHAAWSPLFVRQQLTQAEDSPYRWTPLLDYFQKIPKLDPASSARIEAAWTQHDNDDSANKGLRPKFAGDEAVLTCRRVCTLYGFLDLEHPGTFGPIQLEPGQYRVIWRVQFFDVRKQMDDDVEMFRRDQKLAMADPARAAVSTHGHPMGFPQHGCLSNPSFPHFPILKFSVGYGSSPRQVSDYRLVYGLGKTPVADQVLLPPNDSSPRVDHFVEAMDYWRNADKGWIKIESKGFFEVVRGRPPIFVVSNLDTGDWQGGFRFGGVELVLH